MSSRNRSFWPTITIIAAVFCLFTALPDSLKGWAPSFLRSGLHLGLDLAGGTQLDFRISEDEINAREAELKKEIDEMKNTSADNATLIAKQVELKSVQDQHVRLVEAIRTVLERRINSLGVSEATITPSFFGSEKHLLVECPGVIDVQKCIQTVGKTIQLEFKEQFSGADADYEKSVRAKADAVYKQLTGTGNLQAIGQDLSSTLGVTYLDSQPVYVSELDGGLAPLLKRKASDPLVRLESSSFTTVTDENGVPQVKEVKGIYMVKVLEDRKPGVRVLTDPTVALEELGRQAGTPIDKRTQVDASTAPADIQAKLTSMAIGTAEVVNADLGNSFIVYLQGRVDGNEEMTASHILVQYKGATQAAANVTRTKEEALAKITDIQNKLKGGADFNTLARTQSDGSSKDKNGSIGVLRRGVYPESFDAVAFTLAQGAISDIVETPFGYHIIRADVASHVAKTMVSYTALKVSGAGSADKAAQMIKDIQEGKVTRPEDQIVIRGIVFSLQPTGWQDTALNGQRFRTAAVTTDPVTNVPVVQIQFDEEGAKLFAELTKRNVGKPLAIFVGGELVSAPTVQGEITGGTAVITGSRTFDEATALAQDLNTGAIPAPIYLSGQSTIEATLGDSALQQSVFAAMIGLLILCAFLIYVYRLLGVVASAALMLYVTVLIASMKLPLLLISNTYVVLTLAGIAGMILSMGMAVDANVLAFERIKEELRRGKNLRTAVETGFKKAWPSVRDGNTSTLITCAILFIIGTSIIRGFAITLAVGIFLSLFTAIVVSRFLCRKLAESKFADRVELFGVSRNEIKGQ